MPDTPRRLLLRVTLKLLTLTALLLLLSLFFHYSDEEEEQAHSGPAPLEYDITTLLPAQPIRLAWQGGALQLLRMQASATPYLFYDRGGRLGCPLSWQPAGSRLAPQQPWPGGFRDQCNGVWYRFDGTVLPQQGSAQDLQSPPHRLLSGSLLQIGRNSDNAAPAMPAAD